MQSKTDWLKDWIEKYRKALRDISELDMAIRDITGRTYSRGYYGELVDTAMDAGKNAFAAEAEKVKKKLEAELKEIEDMVEIKNG